MEEYLQTIAIPEHRARMREIFDWISRTFPALQYRTKWNQPMFVEHGTFIIGFSAAKKHLSVAAEALEMERFSNEIREAGYEQTRNLFRIGWNEPVDYALLERIIEFSRADKAECSSFWRKQDP